MNARGTRGRAAQLSGVAAEQAACDRLVREGWAIRGRRLRTAAGEIDIAAERDGLLAFIEVKARPTLAEAAHALLPRQRARLMQAAALLLADNPAWGAGGVRFDVLVVAPDGAMRRISDAFRDEGARDAGDVA